jgi:predicted 2-oxoglutarate/Fe(II)-dependent dioxygenase YbiX
VIDDVVVIDDLLPDAAAHALLAHALGHERDFCPAKVVDAMSDTGHVDAEVRQNLHLKGAGSVPTSVLDAVQAAAPTALERLGVASIQVDRNWRIEAEITCTGDGGFFTAHVDNGQKRLSSRMVTFVYFFGEDPRPFTGGELCVERDWRSGDRIYFTDATPGDDNAPKGMVQVVEPRPNRLVLFRGDRLHEVRRVSSDPDRFAAGRFTVTGWLRSDT